jgi:hypothetical protein
VIRRPNCDSLENAIKSILTLRGQHIERVSGTEWFLTSAVEVEDVYEAIVLG